MTLIIENPYTKQRHELLRRQEMEPEFDKTYKELVAKENAYLADKLVNVRERVTEVGTEAEKVVNEEPTEQSARQLLQQARVLYKLADAYMKEARTIKKELRAHMENEKEVKEC